MAGPALRAARHPAGAAARVLRPRARGRLLRYDQWMRSRAGPRRRRPADDQPALAPRRAPADARAVPPHRADPAQALPVGDHDVGLERGQPQDAADCTSARGARRSTTTSCARSAAAARSSPPTCSTQSNMLPWLATFKRYAKSPRIWGLHSYSGLQPLPAARRDRDAPAAARRQGRGLADRGRRDRPLLHPLPRRPGAARRARRGPSSARSRSRARAAGSSASTSTTGTPTRSSSPGTRRSWPPTAARARRSTSCASELNRSARRRAPRAAEARDVPDEDSSRSS